MNVVRLRYALNLTPPSIQLSVHFSPPAPPPPLLPPYLVGDALLLHGAHVRVVDLLPHQDLAEGRGREGGTCVCVR